ncbi:acyl-CoA carboxylase subunit epsilon [Streptomonospora sp. S1-112]|uniref:Acyl-CoA carboxylase subunit epsilon n=1 Tax=Streptomonospora mangrovi TaxID=2883123 RepID=A0A9X3SG81_9ACTN|nr:acyl-CoA carboxylase subunit epsilon [Streptomonospora mangrovi]MDA0567598.1 acyl-CoA carboxylase subunit epsilon [Streptomonospora mangrovi]
MTTNPEGPAPGPAPFLRVVRGDPSPEEVAALVAVLTARARAVRAARAARGAAREAPPSGWCDRARLVRRPPAPGPGAWRAAYGPG